MSSNRILILMLAATITLQLTSMYRQNANRPPQRPAVQAAPAGTIFDITSLPLKGSPQARLVMVEISDYECPYCAKYATSVGKDIETRFVDQGSIRLAFANNPLPIHENARLLATGAICAGTIGNRYWEMHDALFQRRPSSQGQLLSLATEMGLAAEPFGTCLTQEAPQIARDQDQARRLSLNSTPVFAIGFEDGTKKMSVRTFVNGAQPLAVFEKAIRELLGSTRAGVIGRLPSAG